ncbi:hypothetical protein QBC32DRAFT_19136 [Pseudoneurospora amorphoporcata]|uniref:Uncharacterized protein n=1 Tax=Pseudoneurospora amorphoporcata TaxID=241081 RepID=A0AAN6NQJ0_9PEZI|nr:hypothetical protein QBC32DRAFT_19136 [Pseudoneurospora amorphoporcata]
MLAAAGVIGVVQLFPISVVRNTKVHVVLYYTHFNSAMLLSETILYIPFTPAYVVILEIIYIRGTGYKGNHSSKSTRLFQIFTTSS